VVLRDWNLLRARANTLARRKRARITLVDKARAHLWKPLLHSMAAGSLDFDEHELDYLVQAQAGKAGKRVEQRTDVPGRHTLLLRHFLAAARRQRGDQPHGVLKSATSGEGGQRRHILSGRTKRSKKRSLHGLIVAGPVVGEFWAKLICDKRKSLNSRTHEG
jgi:hypothetical protein